MSINPAMQSAYTFHRRNGYTALQAFNRAREDVATNKPRYPRTIAHGSQIGAPMENGMQWCDPAQIGLRFVGWQDEIRDNLAGRDRHAGWFTNEDQGEVLRGCVYQIPARNGKAVFFPAYREGSHSRKRGWEDTSGEVNAAIHFKDAFSYTDADGAKRDAARAADSFAEGAAEEERNYQDAWRAGSDYADLGTEIAAHRRDALALIREIKAHGESFTPAICAALRANVSSHVRNITKARKERSGLLQGVWDKYRSAFNEAAGISA